MKLTDKQVAEVVVKSLKWDIKYMLEPENDKHASFDEKVELLNAFYKVLKYYMHEADYDKFLRKHAGILGLSTKLK